MVDIHQRIHRIEIYPSVHCTRRRCNTNITPKVNTSEHFDAQILIHMAYHLDRICRMHILILPLSVCGCGGGRYASLGDEDLAVCFEEDRRVLDLQRLPDNPHRLT